MDFAKRGVQINAEVSRLNLGKAVMGDSSTIGFKKMCIDLSFSSVTRNHLARQVDLYPLECLEYRVAGWSSLDCGQPASSVGLAEGL